MRQGLRRPGISAGRVGLTKRRYDKRNAFTGNNSADCGAAWERRETGPSECARRTGALPAIAAGVFAGGR